MALAVTSAPWQQVNMPALDLRRYLGVGLQEGVSAPGDMAVAQRGAGANMSVDVATGEALIQGDTVSNQGRYYVLNDAVTNVTGFTAAHATLPRIDRVTLRIRDAFHGDAANDVSFQIVTGTATSGATLVNLTGAAAVPNSQLLLANILIPATATTITTANIDTTVRARVAIVDAWQAYTPAWAASGTAPVLGNGTLVGKYTQLGKTVIGRVILTMGSTTTFGTGTYSLSLPTTSAITNGVVGTALGNDVGVSAYPGFVALLTPTTVQAWSATTVSTLWGQTVPFTWGSTDILTVHFTYEAA